MNVVTWFLLHVVLCPFLFSSCAWVKEESIVLWTKLWENLELDPKWCITQVHDTGTIYGHCDTTHYEKIDTGMALIGQKSFIITAHTHK